MSDEPRDKSEDREQLRVARRLAAKAEYDAERAAHARAMRESRGGDLVLPDESANLEALIARVRARALAKVEDVLLHSPDERNQLRAAQLLLALEMRTVRDSRPLEAEVLPAKQLQAAVVDEPKDEAAEAEELTDEQIERIGNVLTMRRKVQMNGG